MRLFIYLFFLNSATLSANYSQVDGSFPKLETALAKMEAQGMLSGYLAIKRNGKIIWGKGYGYDSEETRARPNQNTIFKVGSLTKQFVAALILKLQEEGKLSIQSSIAEFLPNYPRGDEIRIDHLVRHTSGIPNFIFFPDYQDFMNIGHSQQQMVDRFKHLPLEFSPGSQYKYSNSGYYLLGMIIEKVTGQAFSQVLAERITKPLGLTNTGMWPAPKAMATGFQQVGEEPLEANSVNHSVPFTAGGMYSTVSDILRWQEHLFSSFLTESSLTIMTTAGLDNYGYGFWIDEANRERRIWHTGGINGFRCVSSCYPHSHLQIVFLGNLEATDVEALESLISKEVLAAK